MSLILQKGRWTQCTIVKDHIEQIKLESYMDWEESISPAARESVTGKNAR